MQRPLLPAEDLLGHDPGLGEPAEPEGPGAQELTLAVPDLQLPEGALVSFDLQEQALPALAAPDNAPLIAAVERNVTLRDNPDLATIAQELRGLANTLGELDNVALLAGRITR